MGCTCSEDDCNLKIMFHRRVRRAFDVKNRKIERGNYVRNRWVR